MSLAARATALANSYPVRNLPSLPIRYLDSEQGADTILLLPGAVGTAESTRFLFAEFAKQYRVVTLSYSPVPTMAALVDQIDLLFAALQLEAVHVVGASYGGMVAQAFAQARPDRARTLVLSHTVPPMPTESRALRWSMPLMRALPFAMTRKLMQRRFTSLLRALPDGDFWSSFLAAEFSRITKADLIAAFDRVLDFNQLVAAPPTVPTILIHSDADEMVKPHHKKMLRQRFPQATEYTFKGGHLVSITQREAYVQVIAEFLASTRSAAAVR